MMAMKHNNDNPFPILNRRCPPLLVVLLLKPSIASSTHLSAFVVYASVSVGLCLASATAPTAPTAPTATTATTATTTTTITTITESYDGAQEDDGDEDDTRKLGDAEVGCFWREDRKVEHND